MVRKPRILKTLNNSPRFFYWDFDVFIVGLIPFFVGLWTGTKTLMVMAIPLSWALSSLKRRYPSGGVMHLLYWVFPTKSLKHLGVKGNIPPSHKRRYFL